MRLYTFFFAFLLLASAAPAQPADWHGLHFPALATSWDEGIPLGNGLLGALIWQKDGQLRLSLDRSDLWDQRPMKGLHRPEFRFDWVAQQVAKKDYAPVQRNFDWPYDNEPAPTKIPGGALEFDIREWGAVKSADLHLQNAVSTVRWANGTVFSAFVHAQKPVGWFRFDHLPNSALIPRLVPPRYEGAVKNSADPVGGDDLSRLGYQQGSVQTGDQHLEYHQTGWGGFSYTIAVHWHIVDAQTVEGAWSITTNREKGSAAAGNIVSKAVPGSGYGQHWQEHSKWWAAFWRQSAVHLPDSLLERQWYLELYKFGAASRRGAPPISLQAVWTADNGRIPPWKGDYHHDLNTQLSYWPGYASNHLEESLAYLDHLDANKANYRRYTQLYFGKNGLNVPGVTTLDGTEMGGWIQYSLSPTISAWLSQHYYLQWRYSMDPRFLKKRAYPWVREVAIFLREIAPKGSDGLRHLPISSSPEVNDNSLSAWFSDNTNYDLALMKYVFQIAAEMAEALRLTEEAREWRQIGQEFGPFAVDERQSLKFAPTLAYTQSHRHFSHTMAIHPLGLIRWEDGPAAQRIIQSSIRTLDSIGPAWWTGYTYAWLANIKARAKDGAGAAEALRIFSKAFCLKNSFHVNGDQTQSSLSNFTYKPFTLEGNFACAAGIQEMLLQDYAGFINIMPAVPATWQEVSFDNLRAMGAFLVSAEKRGGRVERVRIVAAKGGSTRLLLPFANYVAEKQVGVSLRDEGNGFVQITCKKGGTVVLVSR